MANQYEVEWPSDDKPLYFGDIADNICDAIRFAYKLERQDLDKNIPWNGPNIGQGERATCLTPKQRLEAKSLRWALDDQGRDALDEIVSIAVQLGIEQGWRMFKGSTEFRLLLMESQRPTSQSDT